MYLVVIIDILVVAILAGISLTKGLERALPFFVFVVVFFPEESMIRIPGLFNLDTRRVAITALFALYLFLPDLSRQREPARAKTPLRFLLAAACLWALISTLASVVPLVSLKQMLSQVVEYYLLYYILVRTISGVQTLNKILGAMVLAVCLASAFGSYEAYTGWNVTAQWFPTLQHFFNKGNVDISRGYRVSSTFDNYSLFGAAIAFEIVEAFYLLPLIKGGMRKALLWIGMLLMFLSIYKTTSRGPWLALIIGFAMLTFFCRRKTRRSMAAIAGLTVAVLVIRPGVWQTVKDQYLATWGVSASQDDVEASSYEYRYALMDIGAEALARDPIRQVWGYGLGSWYYLDLHGPFGTNPDYHFLSCDNAWVELMTESGYVGLFLTAILLLVPAWRTFKDVWKLPKPDNYLSWVLFINMIQYFFMMTNVAIYSWGQTGYMLWMWIAMAMVYKRVLDGERSCRGSEARRAELADSEPLTGRPTEAMPCPV